MSGYIRHRSGLLVPNPDRGFVNNGKGQGRGGTGGGGGAAPGTTPQIIISMDYESTALLDTGTAGSTWSIVGAASRRTTAPLLAGIGSLDIPSSITDAISTPYNASNKIPATGDWDITIRGYSFATWATGGVGKYLWSVQDATPTAAGTALALSTNFAGQLSLIVSDGVTRSVLFTSSGGNVMASGTNQTVLVKRRGTTFSISVDGTTPNTATSSIAINFPTGSPVWRVGAPVFTSSGAEHLVFDSFQVTKYV